MWRRGHEEGKRKWGEEGDMRNKGKGDRQGYLCTLLTKK